MFLMPLPEQSLQRNFNLANLPAVSNLTNESVIKDLLDNDRLTAHFQPIVSLQQAKVFAYEALCRIVGPNPFDNIEELFHQARICGKSLQLDMRCRQNGLALAAAQDLNDKEALLFLNICPTSLLHPDHSAGTTGILANKYGIPKHNIVLEITEQEAVSNYKLFRTAIDHYRSKGFRIAIDDFGAGYGGLKMLSVLEPDFVKIDRHFFKDSPKGNINFNWKLMMAPEPVIDYVIIHELAHLKEMNHSKKFWNLVAEYCPLWHKHRKWLKEHDLLYRSYCDFDGFRAA